MKPLQVMRIAGIVSLIGLFTVHWFIAVTHKNAKGRGISNVNNNQYKTSNVKADSILESLDSYADVKLVEKFVAVRDVGDVFCISTDQESKRHVLLFHGALRSSEVWQETKTLQILSKAGYHAVAVDLPAAGKTPRLRRRATHQYQTGPTDFTYQLVSTLELNKPVLVSAGSSGKFSVRFVQLYPENVTGFVAVSASIGETYFAKEEDFTTCSVPTLSIYGDMDTGGVYKDELYKLMPNSQTKVIKNAKYECYLDNPELFHKYLLEYLENLDWLE
ncbi:putative protein-lysine deacylase ABHD14B [Clavelina lepadiformis]|uniref:putative protein-lysine deacylase ABHD14B n=1 Tax=Clavelina lepadiformis TaxID=159417 RepID=UPI0040434651